MPSPTPRRWPGVLRIAVGVSVLAALIYYVDPRSLVPLFARIEPSWLLAAACAILAATLLGAANLLLLFQRDTGLRFGRFLPLYWVAWAVGLVVPGQIGDMASITAMLHRRGHVWQTVLSRSVVDKLTSFIVLILFALVSVHHLLPLWIVIATLLAMLVSAVAGLWLFSRMRRFAQRRGGRFARWYGWIDSLLSHVWDCCVRVPHRVALNFLLTVVKTIVMGVAYWSVFRALGVSHVGLIDVVPLMAASSLVAYLPISFNGIGTVEAAGLVLFGLLQVPAEVVLAAYLLLRATVMMLAWLPAAGWLLLSKQAADKTLR